MAWVMFEMFWFVFPLHANTFHRLFQHSTQPQLEELKFLVNGFVSLEQTICLNFQFLELFNSYYNIILVHIVSSFEYFSTSINSISDINLFIIKIKKHLNSIIEFIHKILLKSFKHISYIIRIIAFYFNILLQTDYENFKKKIEEHKTSLEEKIKEYIQNINESLKKHCCCVQEFIKSICENIKSLNENYNKLGEFIHEKPEKLIKLYTRFEHPAHTTHFQTIFETHTKYKGCLEKCYSEITPELTKFTKILIHYNSLIGYTRICLCKYNHSVTDPNTIETRMNSLKKIKTFYLNNFNNYLSCVKKLEEIGEHIKTIKFNLNEVQGKVKDEAAKYIKGLKDIEVDPYQFEEDIKQIKWMNQNIIDMLKIVKHTIDFYKSLDVELKKLNGVKFAKYDFTEFLRNSNTMEEKLKQFQEQIESHLKKLKSSYENIPGHTFLMEGDVYSESYYQNLISTVETLILTTLQEISVIRYIIYNLLIIKSNSIIIEFVKKKINEIKDVDTALKGLPEILEYLKTFYHIHRNSMNMVILFNSISFARHYINKYVDSLRLVKYHIEILIFVIKCYIWILSVIKFVTNELSKVRQKIDELIPKSQEMKKLKGYKSNIISSLKSIDSSLKTLKSVNSNLDIKTLKNNMSVIKYHINQVYQNILGAEVNLNEIYKLISKLYMINTEILNVQKSINEIMIKIISFNNYLYYTIIIILFIERRPEISEEKRLVFVIYLDCLFKLTKNLESITNYLKNVNSVIDKIGIKDLIDHIESQIKIIEKLVNRIESNMDKINKGVVDMECAIEGVARNLIRCSILSLSNITVNSISIGIETSK